MRYWFKRRRYGYGFTPATVPGIVSLLVLVVALIVPPFIVPLTSARRAIGYLIWTVVVVIGFLVLILIKSPRPRWRWGWKPGDNPDEDI